MVNSFVNLQWEHMKQLRSLNELLPNVKKKNFIVALVRLIWFPAKVIFKEIICNDFNSNKKIVQLLRRKKL